MRLERLIGTDERTDHLAMQADGSFAQGSVPAGQPAEDSSDRVRWYTLQRATPLFDPAQKDQWTVPRKLSPEAAPAYFAKHEGFDEGLEIIDHEGPLMEFVLEKREVLRRQVDASQSAGKLVDTYLVRRQRK